MDEDVFLIYNSHGCETGPKLAEEMGIESGEDTPRKFDYLLRWGSSNKVHYASRTGVFNPLSAVRRNTHKLKSLRVMSDNGIVTPPFSTSARDLDFPVVGRGENHMQGRDVELYLQPRDVSKGEGSDYYVQYIPKKAEYRFHVIDGEVVKVSEKVPTEGYDKLVWNYENGFTFRNPRTEYSRALEAMSIDSVKALGLDFGAVDMLLSDEGIPYVLEVNTAPSLDEEHTLPVYAEKLEEVIKGCDS